MSSRVRSRPDTPRRIAAIYDIHANLPALEAVIEDIHRAHVDEIVVGGDVFPGPMPLETMRCLLECDVPLHFIRGNGDREVLASMRGAETSSVPEPAREAIRWVAQLLPRECEEWLSGWPESVRMRIEGWGEVLFCHATPQNDTEMFTRLTSEERLLRVFDGLEVQGVVCGHTHMQFDRNIGEVRVVNAGSVGMPFGEPGAYWLLLRPEVELHHTHYDLAKAAERIRGTTYPQAEEFAARNILQPPTEREMLEVFSRVELT